MIRPPTHSRRIHSSCLAGPPMSSRRRSLEAEERVCCWKRGSSVSCFECGMDFGANDVIDFFDFSEIDGFC